MECTISNNSFNGSAEYLLSHLSEAKVDFVRRFRYSGLRIYILIFRTEVEGATSFRTVERVFESFQTLK